jgi:hypothetical protein
MHAIINFFYFFIGFLNKFYTIFLEILQMLNSVHANIIYHFTKYVQWSANPSGDFIIGIAGDDEAFDALKKVTMNKMIGNHRIVVKKIDNVNDASGCMILFITYDESALLKKIIQLFPSEQILIVTEKEGLGQKGACINFRMQDDKLTLEINKNNIEKRNLKIGTELLGLGTIVK